MLVRLGNALEKKTNDIRYRADWIHRSNSNLPPRIHSLKEKRKKKKKRNPARFLASQTLIKLPSTLWKVPRIFRPVHILLPISKPISSFDEMLQDESFDQYFFFRFYREAVVCTFMKMTCVNRYRFEEERFVSAYTYEGKRVSTAVLSWFSGNAAFGDIFQRKRAGMHRSSTKVISIWYSILFSFPV